MGKKILCLSIAMATFLMLMTVGHFFLKPHNYDSVVVLDEGWRVYYNDTVYENVALSDLRKIIGDGAHKGDVIHMVHPSVEVNDFETPTIMFESRFSAWILYTSTIETDRGFMDSYKAGKFIGCENNFVNLPNTDRPVDISISLLVTEDGAYNYFEAPALAGYYTLLLYSIYNNIFIFMSAAFLVIFGLMFFAVGLGFRSDMPEINMQMYSSLVFIALGIWLLTQFRILDLFVETNGHQTEIEYISLYMVVPLMYLVMGSMRNYLHKTLFQFFSTIGAIIPLVLIGLHFAGIAHINQYLFIYQIDAMVLIVFMFVMILVKDAGSNLVTQTQYIQIMGQAMLALSFIFNIFFYYMEVLGYSKQIMLSKKAVPLGAISMVFATLVNYNIFISESIARKKEYESLAHLAYADELTGIANRSKYEKYIKSISEKPDDYCIISIDLNGLKEINDNQGHLMGDKYLFEFGGELEKCFGNDGFLARIGGDEFVVILTGESMLQVDYLIDGMKHALATLNEKDPIINRSAAIGYAYRHECEGKDANAVYLLADERMYKNKQLMHGTRR